MPKRDKKEFKELSSPRTKTIKKLFSLAGNNCAFPKCRNPVIDPTSGSIVVEICHIKGEQPTSARHDSAQTPEERHGFENLILLCGTHHKVIDDDDVSYTNERLYSMKAAHEAKHQGGPEPSDDIVNRLIEHMNRLWAQDSTLAEQQGLLVQQLRARNLETPQQSEFAKTKYSVKMGLMDDHHQVLPWPVYCVFFSVLPKQILSAAAEPEFLKWMDSNQRRYEPLPACSFLPLECAKIGKGHVWFDRHPYRFVPAHACYKRYLAVELDGYVEYGFYPGAPWEEEEDRLYYARLIGETLAFLNFIRDLCIRFSVDLATIAIGFALHGVSGKQLLCVTEKVLPHFQSHLIPMNDKVLHLHQPGDWNVLQLVRQFAENILDVWSFSTPAGFGTPEFSGENYEGEIFKKRFRSY